MQNPLVQCLQAHIQQLFANLDLQSEKTLYVRFDPSLFSENGQPLAFYWAEIEKTLADLNSLHPSQSEACQFLGDKLLAQCQALQQTLAQGKTSKKVKSNLNLMSQREKLKQSIHQLPPRERLAKYYEALQALNDKIEQQQQSLQQAPNHEKNAWLERIQVTQQRKVRCQEAIDMLEEYLAMVAETGK